MHDEVDPPVPRRPRLDGPRLAALLLGLLVLVLAMWPRDRFDPVESASVLLARSLVEDRDRTWDPADEERLGSWRESAGAPDPDSAVPSPALSSTGDGTLAVPTAYGLFLAPFVAVGGVSGAYLAQALLIGLGLWAVGGYWRPRLYLDTIWTLLAFFALSALLPSTLHLWPEVFLAAVMLGFLALVYGGQARTGFAPEIYGDAGGSTGARLRWVGAGLLLGVLVASQPALVGFVLPALVQARRDEAGRGALVLGGVGCLASLGVLVGPALAGLPEAVRGLGLPDLHLAGWNALYLVVGRHVGVLLYFAPLLLLPFCGREPGRRSLLATVGLSALLLLWWQPWTFAGLPWAIGARGFLPLYAALWFLVDRPVNRWAWVGVALLAGAMLWPTWTHLRQPVADDQGRPIRTPSYLAPWLPWETSQVGLAAESEVAVGGVSVRMLNPAAWRGEDGTLRVMGGVPAELLVVSPQPVTGLRFEVAEEGGAELALRGGELRQNVYRPDGSVGFLVGAEVPRRYHPLPPHGDRRYFRTFLFELPQAPRRPIEVGIAGVETALVDVETEGAGDE